MTRIASAAIAAAAWLAAVPLPADTGPAKPGAASSARLPNATVLCAEVGNADVGALDLCDKDDRCAPKDNAKAVVTLRLDPKSGLSLYDYVLVPQDSKEAYPCAAIQKGSGAFRSMGKDDWLVQNPDAKELYSLLFFVPPPTRDDPVYTLVWVLGGEKMKLPGVPVRFKKLGDAPFTPPAQVPKEGCLPVDAPPAAAAAPAASSGADTQAAAAPAAP